MKQNLKNGKIRGVFLAAVTTLTLLASITSCPVRAQLWKKVKDRVKRTIENKVTQKSEDVTNKTMDKAEIAIQGKKPADSGSGAAGSAQSSPSPVSTPKATVSDYRSYDFVPGDKIIFEPDIRQEADAELPARFKLIKGNAEIQSYEGDKLLHLDKGARLIISPLMSTENYLPAQFTVEFDMSYEVNDSYMRYVNYFDVDFQKSDKQFDATPLYQFRITSGSGCEWGDGGHIHLPESLAKALAADGSWHHIAIYINKNIGKVYIDQYRVAASNTLATGAGKMALGTDGRYGVKIKNFRLAAGGSDKYDKVVTDGKFITHGILFDVAKASIKPQSAGTLNEVVKMMQAHPALRFEIDGHTDNDGTDETNLKLSEQRAAAVKTELVKLGIAPDRLSTKGLGERQPIDSNDTQEGKANNRRVEFIKM